MHQRVGKKQSKLHASVVPQKESRRLGNEYNNLVSPNPANKNHFLLKLSTVLLPRKRRGEGPFHQVTRGVQGPVGRHSAQLHVGLCTWGWLPHSGCCGRRSTTERVSAAQAVACLGGSNDRTPDGSRCAGCE